MRKLSFVFVIVLVLSGMLGMNAFAVNPCKSANPPDWCGEPPPPPRLPVIPPPDSFSFYPNYCVNRDFTYHVGGQGFMRPPITGLTSSAVIRDPLGNTYPILSHVNPPNMYEQDVWASATSDDGYLNNEGLYTIIITLHAPGFTDRQVTGNIRINFCSDPTP